MRKFARSHWKILIAILLAVALATLTLETDSAPSTSAGPDLSVRLRAHVQAMAPREAEQAARHIGATLAGYGYRVERHAHQGAGRKLRNIEAALSNLAPGAKPERIFIVGARYDPGAPDGGGGTAAVLELARLLKTMQPGRGTEVKFVFFVNGEASPQHARELGNIGANVEAAPIARTVGWYSQAQNCPRLAAGPERHVPDAGNFIAFAGTLESSASVRQALAAFRAQPDSPSEGLAAPAHVMGLTLSDHASYQRQGYPALMITDTAFLRYPYYHTGQGTPDQPDYAGMARVVTGLARTIDSLAGATRI